MILTSGGRIYRSQIGHGTCAAAKEEEDDEYAVDDRDGTALSDADNKRGGDRRGAVADDEPNGDNGERQDVSEDPLVFLKTDLGQGSGFQIAVLVAA